MHLWLSTMKYTPLWGLVCRGGRVTKRVFNGRVSWWKCTRPFGVVLAWILVNKLLLGVGCSGRIARLKRWNETSTYWLVFGVVLVAAWPFQAEDLSPLAPGIPNWTVKFCPFSHSQGHPTSIFGKYPFGRRFEIYNVPGTFFVKFLACLALLGFSNI